jgi:hypothetical protein
MREDFAMAATSNPFATIESSRCCFRSRQRNAVLGHMAVLIWLLLSSKRQNSTVWHPRGIAEPNAAGGLKCLG